MSALALLAIVAAGRGSASALLLFVLILLAYSAASGWLYIARLAAYVQLSSSPASPAPGAAGTIPEPAPSLS